MFGRRSKNKKVLLTVLLFVLLLGIFIIFYSNVLFQEGSPWPQIKGIAQLNFGDQDLVRLDIGENKYISKGNNLEAVKVFMKNRGYDFTEQMGSGYFFKSPAGFGALATHRYYSRFYSLWTISYYKIK